MKTKDKGYLVTCTHSKRSPRSEKVFFFHCNFHFKALVHTEFRLTGVDHVTTGCLTRRERSQIISTVSSRQWTVDIFADIGEGALGQRIMSVNQE